MLTFLHSRAGKSVFILTIAVSAVFLFRATGFIEGAKAATTIQNSVPVTSVSAASFLGSPAPLAPNSIVAAFGTQLATGVEVATSQPLPTTLLNTAVTVNGAPAPLFFVSPGQVNYLIPPATPAGDVQVVVTSTLGNGDQVVSRGQMKIAQSAPALFTANANGIGAPAAVTGRVNAQGQFVFDPAAPIEPDPLKPGQFLPAPVDPGTEAQPAFLILYGTGARNAPAGSVRAIIGGIDAPVSPVAAPGFTGLDQINLQIPTSLRGRGNIDVSIVANGISSNPVTVNIAGNSSAGLAVSGFSVTDPATAGQTIAIQGTGFSTTAAQNIVRFGPAQARVISASSNQLSVIVPFGAESSRVTVQTQQGEARSNSTFRVRTSISGIVQSTGASSSSPAPLEGVTIRVVGSNQSVRTNSQGSFVLADATPGVSQIEVDGNTAGNDPPFPRVTLKVIVRADRDNQFVQPISLQQISGGSGAVGGGSGLTGEKASSSANLREFKSKISESLNKFEPAGGRIAPAVLKQLGTPGKSVLISNGGVSLEIPIGAGVRFPDGKTSGQMQLTVIEKSRLPGINLPVGVYSPTIVQITPLGSTFSPGASLSFPTPDPSLPAGAKVDLYRFDFQNGVFQKRGTATISQDRTKAVSDGRIVDLASFWFAAASSNVTTVAGRVLDSFGFPVPGALVTVNGRSDTCDQNGGYNIADVSTQGSAQIQVEAVLPQQYGVPPRGLSPLTNIVPGGVTNVETIRLSDTDQPALVLSPFVVDLASNSQPQKIEISLTQPAPAGGLAVSLRSSDTGVVTVPATVTIPAGQTTASFNITRAGPGVALIEATATLGAVLLENFAFVSVSQAAPQLTGVSPQSAPPGATILISGVGLSAICDNNFIGFVRDGGVVAFADTYENEVIIDQTGRPAIRVEVPFLGAGPVGIVAAVVDESSGIISDDSAPIAFTVLGSNVNAPVLAGVAPAQGKPRDQITITGSGFSQNPDENEIIFRQDFFESPARIIRSTSTQLVAEVPAFGVSKGAATIVVRRYDSNGASSALSNALDFSITEDPTLPAKPAILSVLNAATQTASGKDGDPIVISGSNFGRNFFDLELGDIANDEPQATLLLFYQNDEFINFAFPFGASNGTQLISVVPSGLFQGQAIVTALTVDLDTGQLSEESNPVTFNITASSLRRVDEAEPNDSTDLATEVFPQTLVEGSAAKEDPADLLVTFEDGTTVPLNDLFYILLEKQTTLTLSLSFNQTADLDLFVFQEFADGEFEIYGFASSRTANPETLTVTLPIGDYLIAVGSFSGSSDYELSILEGAPAAAATAKAQSAQSHTVRNPVVIRRKKK